MHFSLFRAQSQHNRCIFTVLMLNVLLFIDNEFIDILCILFIYLFYFMAFYFL